MLIKWIARGAAMLSCGMLLLFMWAGYSEGIGLPSVTEGIGLTFFPVGVVLGLLLGWKQPTYGGCVAIVSLFAFYCWHWVVSERLPSGPFFAAFTFPALLYLWSGWLSNHRASTTL